MPNKRENYDWKLPNLPIDNLPRIPNMPNMPNMSNMSNMPNMPNMPNFQQKSKDGCVIFAFAEWCGHCRNYRPTWENIKSNNGGDYDFVEAEEGKLPDESKLPMDLKKGNKSRESLDNALGSVRGFPTLFFVKNGKVTEIMNRNKLMDEIKKM
jgi:thiol-disulfide isomerase/thioredoxin